MYMRLTLSGRKVEDSRPDSASRMGMNSFTRRRKLMEEHLSPDKLPDAAGANPGQPVAGQPGEPVQSV